jgi:nucleotidyltransferase AbiEii toxin of type IV toxin-antitoxin system
MENMREDAQKAELKLDILPEAQRRLWEELSDTPDAFVLYGGTAIALRLGHRQSVDFDFFAFGDINPDQLMKTVPYLANAKNARTQPNTLDAILDRDGNVHVSFFGLPKLRQIMPPIEIENPKLKIADMLDLAGTKMSVVQHRAQAKDYLDAHAIFTKTDITPEQACAAASLIYGDRYNVLDTLKALAYFGEPELQALPEELKDTLAEMVRQFDMACMATHIKELKS